MACSVLNENTIRPAYIAGVTNPIFESGGSWDLLLDIASGRVIISKDIHTSCPPTYTAPAPSLLRTGTFRVEHSTASEDDFGRIGTKDGPPPGQKSELVARADSHDNMFMEDVSSILCLA